MTIRSKKDLELVLSSLVGFKDPSVRLEQYATPAEIAADWIWNMALQGDIVGKVVLDAACGPGILGIGALLMGAKKVFFVDKSEEAVKIAKENYSAMVERFELGEGEFTVSDISLFDNPVEVVVENPPFGTKEKHIDKLFLEKAFSIGKVVWSMHKYSTKRFVEAICKDFGFEITHRFRYDFRIKAMFEFHHKRTYPVDVGLWRMERMDERN